MSSEEVKGRQFNLGGEYPLLLCEECIQHKITAPTMGASIIFLEKAAQYGEAVAADIRGATQKEGVNAVIYIQYS